LLKVLLQKEISLKVQLEFFKKIIIKFLIFHLMQLLNKLNKLTEI